MSAAALAAPTSEYMLPEPRALAMLEACARQIESAATLPEIAAVLTQADAIAVVARKVAASERVKRTALALLVDAEIQLGRITKAIPLGRTGCKPDRTQPTKAKTLAEHQLSQSRCSLAERLAEVPREKVAGAIGKAKRMTMREVLVDLELRPQVRGVSRGMRKVAFDAVALLVRCQSERRAPRGEEVEPLRDAFLRADA